MEERHGQVHQNTSAARLFAGEFGTASRVDTEFGGSELGLGVLENLAGEVVSLDGETFAIPENGVPQLLQHDEGLAFALSARGGTHYPVALETGMLTESTLLDLIDNLIVEHHENPSTIVATVRLHARFTRVLLRTVSRPSADEHDLPTVLAHEHRFELHDWIGTLGGFRFPDLHTAQRDPGVEAVEGQVISGLHLHGLSDKRDSGGHLHEFEIQDISGSPISLSVTLDELEPIR